MAHNWNYRILATPAQTTVKTRLNIEDLKQQDAAIMTQQSLARSPLNH